MIKKFIKWLKYFLSHKWCYDTMEERGIAIAGYCNGVAGGSKEINYLSESCMDCPYFTPVDVER